MFKLATQFLSGIEAILAQKPLRWVFLLQTAYPLPLHLVLATAEPLPMQDTRKTFQATPVKMFFLRLSILLIITTIYLLMI
ncbi:MAG: hypothetical protein CL509_10365 [Actinobacteria bacterium]|nr:hypothetical protein [Actinomycetota bacterium]